MADAAAPLAFNPFPGLRPFRPGEEHLFFGRESQVDRMVDKLGKHRFLGVVGTSASGKSSLVNCGLRPALHRGAMAKAGTSWRMAQFRPGGDPIGALARALAVPGVLLDEPADGTLPAHELVELTLRLGSLGLVDMVEQARLPAGTQVLVVADQFEELFRFQAVGARANAKGSDAREDAGTLVRLLLEASAHPDVPIHVVLTMRSDFLGECARFERLPEALNESQYLVPRLTRGEMRSAVTGPVAVARGAISPVLVTRVLNDVGGNSDQLSILQHALNRTWAHWRQDGPAQREIVLADYEAIGGMEQALDRHAEEAFGELRGSANQALCERVFKALTDKGTDPRGIRRPTRLSTLCAITGESQHDVEAVLVTFREPSRSFVMPPHGEPLTPDTVIDISHESLMRAWCRLSKWADDEADSARQYRRLSETAALWEKGQANPWSGVELDDALAWRGRERRTNAWAAQYRDGFDRAMKFLDTSREADVAEKLKVEVERRWRAGWWLVPIVVAVAMFAWLHPHVASLLSRHGERIEQAQQWVDAQTPLVSAPPMARKQLSLLFTVLAGMPALCAYLLLSHYGRIGFGRVMTSRLRRRAGRTFTASMDQVPLEVALPPAVEVHHTSYAGFWRRALAHAIDTVICLVASFAILVAVLMVPGMTNEKNEPLEVAFWAWLIASSIFWCVYRIGLVASGSQGTFGMYACRTFATDRNGRRLSLGRAIVRHVAAGLSTYSILLGYMIQPFNERRQTLHDLISGTVVLRGRPTATAKARGGAPHADDPTRRAPDLAAAAAAAARGAEA